MSRAEPADRAAAAAPAARATARQHYLVALAWAFTLFNGARVFAYMPTLWAIWVSGDSSQHSILTWFTWMGANATMAAWLYEQNGQRMSRAVAMNLSNAAMCAAGTALIVWTRFF